MLIIERSLNDYAEDVLLPFAWEELVCRKVGEGALPPVAHLWRHPGAMVLGLRDRRLPAAEEAMDALRRRGLSVGVRHLGGAAVPLDRGVVNLSLILPHEVGARIDFHKDFRHMTRLITEAVGLWGGTVHPGMIQGAYCPGEYDLAIEGKKFCGIAQRRQLKASIVSAFIVVEGSGEERAVEVRSFYEQATGGQAHADDPGILPGSTASLAELTEEAGSAEAFMRVLCRRLEQEGGQPAHPQPQLPAWEETARTLAELRRRYDSNP